MRVATVLLIAALSATGSVPGQAVRGQLIDSISRAPVPGAFVTLVDEQGVERVRAMTNTAGEFVLSAPVKRCRSSRVSSLSPSRSPRSSSRDNASVTSQAAHRSRRAGAGIPAYLAALARCDQYPGSERGRGEGIPERCV